MTANRHRKTPIWIRVLPFCFLAYLNIGFTGQKHPTDEIAFYIDTYGEIRPEIDQQAALAHKVFARVSAVADKNIQRFPKLVVINNRSLPWAIALPDGNIVISKQALITTHLNADIRETEARLAFVLGHELAHLAHDDFWHREVHQFSISRAKSKKILGNSSNQEIKERELKADDKGFIYAALAGFPVEFLLQDNFHTSDFFTLWMQQTGNNSLGDGNSPKTRTQLLQRRLHNLKDKITLFKFGVRLSHFDYCDDAIYLFKEFQKTYPGREVLNNLGFCYLQLARQVMEPTRAFLYWMPMMLDGETRASSYIQRNTAFLKNLRQAAQGKAEGLLLEAVRYLKKAIEADESYLPARLNLASALLYLGKPHGARDLLADSKRLAPDNPSVQHLDAIALYEQSDVDQDLWPKVITKLKELANNPNATPDLIFNLARLLSLRPRPIESNTYWNQLVPIADRLPKPIEAIVCSQQSKVKIQACKRKASTPTQPLPWQWPLQVSGDKPLSPKNKSILQNWKRIGFGGFTKGLQGHIYQRPEDGAEVLELDQFVHMQVLKGPLLSNVQKLSEFCVKPLRKRILASGTVLSCENWGVMTQGDRIIEALWIAK